MNTEKFKNLTEEEWLDEMLKEIEQYAPNPVPQDSLKILLTARKATLEKKKMIEINCKCCGRKYLIEMGLSQFKCVCCEHTNTNLPQSQDKQ